MALIKWKNEFSVNISAIDTQHKKLIEIINDLHAAMSAGKANDALREIFAKLAARERWGGRLGRAPRGSVVISCHHRRDPLKPPLRPVRVLVVASL